MLTVNWASDSLTSGLRTLIRERLQSAMISFSSSMLALFCVRFEAWNSDG